MDFSIFWARVFGMLLSLYALIVFSNQKKFIKMMADASKNKIVMFSTGFGSLFIGIIIVATHQVWTSDWRGLITLFGWLSIVKGIIRTLYPEKVKLAAGYLAKHHQIYAGLLSVTLLTGLYLLYVGFWQ